ncbi:hypothetical protein Lser_V15G26382 [Lactuca serriola]
MGKLENDSMINHFSHEHPLKLQQVQAQIASQTTCQACNQSVCGSVYSCVSCNFYLHKTCSNLPRTLKHKSDQQHNLALLSSPAYPEGVFKCNACGSQGKGFSYHCPDCQLDLHVVCASMPLLIDHVAHDDHKLSLCFKPPYENQAFSCDICKEPGSNQWLYRCGLCEFDAHMKCAKARTTTSRSVLPKSTSLPHHSSTPRPPPSPTPAPPPIQIFYSSPSPAQYPQVLLKSTSLPSYDTHQYFSSPPQHPTPPPQPHAHSQPYYSQTPQYQHPQPQVSHYQATPTMGVPQYVQPSRQTGLVNNMAGHAVEGLVGSVTQEIIQAVFEGMSS